MTGAGAVAAAKTRRRRQEEEEEETMTAYANDDLDGWEFKMVRALRRRFKTADSVRQLCAEEAEAGWEMVEKFDDSRIRFKRRIERRGQDAYLERDPYRTHIGMTQRMLAIVVVSVTLAVVGLLAVIANLLD